MANIEELKQYKRIHMIGIGGVSMSGIAEILKNWGFIITGSDCSACSDSDSDCSESCFGSDCCTAYFSSVSPSTKNTNSRSRRNRTVNFSSEPNGSKRA